jgi:hypothetical protein
MICPVALWRGEKAEISSKGVAETENKAKKKLVSIRMEISM